MRLLGNAPLRRMVACATLVLAVTGACGTSDDEPRAQPAPETQSFVEGDFGQIPIHPLAEAIGERATESGVVAQSFRLRNTSRTQLFDWYREHLPGWALESPPGPLTDAAGGAWRAQWTRDDRRLVVTTSEAPTLGDEASGDEILQLSLSLEPRTSQPAEPTP